MKQKCWMNQTNSQGGLKLTSCSLWRQSLNLCLFSLCLCVCVRWSVCVCNWCLFFRTTKSRRKEVIRLQPTLLFFSLSAALKTFSFFSLYLSTCHCCASHPSFSSFLGNTQMSIYYISNTIFWGYSGQALLTANVKNKSICSSSAECWYRHAPLPPVVVSVRMKALMLPGPSPPTLTLELMIAHAVGGRDVMLSCPCPSFTGLAVIALPCLLLEAIIPPVFIEVVCPFWSWH